MERGPRRGTSEAALMVGWLGWLDLLLDGVGDDSTPKIRLNNRAICSVHRR